MISLFAKFFRRPKLFMLHAEHLRAFNLPGKLPITAEIRARAEKAGRDTLDERFFDLAFFRDYAPTLNQYLDRFRVDADTASFVLFRRKLPLLVEGLAHDAANRFREARESFEAILRIDPGDAHAHYAIGRARILAGEYGAAASSLREAVRHHPRFHRALLDLGCTYLESGQAERAKDIFSRIMEFSPGDPNAFEGMKRLGEYVAIAGEGENGCGFLRREEFKRRLEHDLVAHWESAEGLRETGERAFAERFFTLARRAFERAFLHRPEPGLQLLIARTLLEEGEFREAYQMLAEPLAQGTADPDLLVAAAEAMLGLARHAEARRHLEAAFARGADPRHADLMRRIHRAAGTAGEGARWLAAFAARHPASPWPHRALAEQHAEFGDPSACCAALAAALERAPHDESLVSDYAMALGRAGRFEEVVALLSGRAGAAASHHVHLWNLGLAYRDLSRRREAIEILRKVMSMDVPAEFKSLARRELDRLFRS